MRRRPGQSADSANHSAQDAYNRVDSLSGVVANLDNYKPVADVSVTFATAKYNLTRLRTRRSWTHWPTPRAVHAWLFILEVTGGTDSVGGAEYNYKLSQQRADAVANYLQSTHNIAPHRFYLVGIGKDQQVATDKTAAGRAKNRRVQVRVLSNSGADATASPMRRANSGAHLTQTQRSLAAAESRALSHGSLLFRIAARSVPDRAIHQAHHERGQ